MAALASPSVWRLTCPPHNLSEVIDGICAQIEDPEITLEGLMQYVKGPDFPTGCMLLGTAGIKQYFAPAKAASKSAAQQASRTQRQPRADRHYRDSIQREPRGARGADCRFG
jgi:DNA gyrase/topoisomerase IV subunit A